MTTSDNISAIEAIEKALEGVKHSKWFMSPWHVEEDASAVRNRSDRSYICNASSDSFATYIAACNPVAMSAILAEARKAEAMENAEHFQARVSAAHHALFHDDPTDVAERRARFFEESNETCQSLGMTEDEAIELVRYTYSRPAGEPKKEIGAAALTLASLCVVAGYDMMDCAEADLENLQRSETVERIRAKRATRHGRGPLPGFDPARTLLNGGSDAQE